MHKIAMEIGKKVMEEAKAKGLDNFNAEDWEKLKYTMEIVKNAICADKDYRIVCAMDEAEEEEKFMGRMGYRGRARNGRFVHRPGRGRSAGYTPYLHMMDDGMDDYDMYDDIPYPMTGYRMGYTKDNDRMDGMETRRPSRYGESYDRYSERRRHYHETKDAESKKQMDESMKEYMADVMENMRDMWKDADPTLRQTMKADLTKMVQQLQ